MFRICFCFLKDKASHFNISDGFLRKQDRNVKKKSGKFQEFYEKIQSEENRIVEAKSDFAMNYLNFRIFPGNFAKFHVNL